MAFNLLDPGSWGWGTDYPTGESASLKSANPTIPQNYNITNTPPAVNQNLLPPATTTVPKATIPNIPVQTTSNFMDYYPGWNPDVARADFQAQYGGDINRLASAKGGGGSSGGEDISGMINEMYGPAMSALQQVEAYQPTIRDTALSGLQNQKSAYQQTLDMLKKQGIDMLGSQSQDLLYSQQKAEAKSLRDLNAAQQQNQARFGGGTTSSTSNAVSEILLGEFLRNGGDIRTAYANGQKVIFQKQRENQEKYDADVQNLEKDFQQGVKEINDNFQTRLQEISMKKAEIEANKTAQRIQALQESVASARTLEEYKAKKMFDLGVWDMERKAELGQKQAWLDDFTAKIAGEMAAKKNEMSSTANTSFLSYNSPNQTYSTYKQPNRNITDEYQQLFA